MLPRTIGLAREKLEQRGLAHAIDALQSRAPRRDGPERHRADYRRCVAGPDSSSSSKASASLNGFLQAGHPAFDQGDVIVGSAVVGHVASASEAPASPAADPRRAGPAGRLVAHVKDDALGGPPARHELLDVRAVGGIPARAPGSRAPTRRTGPSGSLRPCGTAPPRARRAPAPASRHVAVARRAAKASALARNAAAFAPSSAAMRSARASAATAMRRGSK
jgi:hypothetical protein